MSNFALSPLDGRYADKVFPIKNIFSEGELIHKRVEVEIKYFLYLAKILPKLNGLTPNDIIRISNISQNFNTESINRVKDIEKTTNHDVKAVEYYIKEEFDKIGLGVYKEFIHFGLTSQDINSVANMFQIREYITSCLKPVINDLINTILLLNNTWQNIPMLSRTHGQPATPTTLGLQFMVFAERLENQIIILDGLKYRTKFGGATGGLNAHYIPYPDTNWRCEMTTFIKSLGLERNKYTTQVDHYDNFAEVFDCVRRINTILIDMVQDIWLYISFEYFKLKIKEGEVGSSTMPHKVNPIDFENAKGNFKMANGLLETLSRELPVSMLQRELTDSTMTRNIGSAFGYGYLGLDSLLKGILKLEPNIERIDRDLNENYVVIGEAIQTILRAEGYDGAYELLKTFTRKNIKPNKNDFEIFIRELDINDGLKDRLINITPHNYLPH